MASFRRNHLPKWIRVNRYLAFQIYLQFGKKAPINPWRIKNGIRDK